MPMVATLNGRYASIGQRYGLIDYSPSMTTATLNDLVQNDHGLRVFCDRCRRCAELDVPFLVSRYGTGMALPEVSRRAKCGECGGKGGSVQVVAVRW